MSGITIELPKGFMGQCTCGNDAKHTIWAKFLKPIPAELGLPECKGIWHCVCDDCLKPDDIHKT